jgi:hypothetical protein
VLQDAHRARARQDVAQQRVECRNELAVSKRPRRYLCAHRPAQHGHGSRECGMQRCVVSVNEEAGLKRGGGFFKAHALKFENGPEVSGFGACSPDTVSIATRLAFRGGRPTKVLFLKFPSPQANRALRLTRRRPSIWPHIGCTCTTRTNGAQGAAATIADSWARNAGS